MSSKRNICLVNRNYPPVPGATGHYASQLVEHLRGVGHTVKVVSIGQASTADHIQLSPHYDGKKKWLRMFSAFAESYKLIRTAKRQGADVYIIMSDPPFLNYWASRLLKGVDWWYWSMDVFPAAFIANGLVTSNNFFVQHFKKSIQRNPPKHLISLGVRQTEFVKREFEVGEISSTVIPIGIKETANLSDEGTTDDLTFGYVGTVGEAHDLVLLLAVLKAISDSGHHVVIRAMGSKGKALESVVADWDNVTTHEYVNDDLMREIDVQIVSLQHSWTHISVPSKAITAACNGSAVLFLGSSDSDTWDYIKDIGWQITNSQEVESVVSNITTKAVSNKKKNLPKVVDNLLEKQKSGFAEIVKALL